MEVAEKIYKYDTTSKIPIRVDTNRAVLVENERE